MAGGQWQTSRACHRFTDQIPGTTERGRRFVVEDALLADSVSIGAARSGIADLAVNLDEPGEHFEPSSHQ
jgi:hypothetical protein